MDFMASRLRRLTGIARRRPRAALAGYARLELLARRSGRRPIQLAALYQRYFTLERLGEAAGMVDQLGAGLQLAEQANLPADVAAMLEALGRIAYTLGTYRDAMHYWTRCIDVCSANLLQHAGVEARIGLGQIYDALGDHATGARFHQDAANLLHGVDAPYLHAKVALNLGFNQYEIGQTEAAEQQFQLALAASQRGGIDEFEAEAHWHLGLAALGQGDFANAERHTRDALRLAEACGNIWALAAALETLGQIERRQERIGAARATYQSALAWAVKIGALPRQAACYRALSELAEQQGDLAAALEHMREHMRLNADLATQLSAPDRLRVLQQYDLSHKSQIELLLELASSQVLNSTDRDDALAQVCEAACAILRIDYLCLWLRDEDSGQLRCCAMHGPAQQATRLGQVLPPGMAGMDARLREGAYEERVVHDIRLHPSAAQLQAMLDVAGLRSLIEIPLRLHGEPVGLLYVGQLDSQRNWTREDVLFGRHIGNLVEQILNNIQHLAIQQALRRSNEELEERVQARTRELEGAYHELEQVSLTDTLTGLRNRRFLNQQIDADVAMVLRHHEDHLQAPQPDEALMPDLVFFMVDLDHFKQVNDQYGHAAGDLVLVQMRHRLQKVFRESDYLVRWGGEEFLVVTRSLARAGAAAMAERLRSAVADTVFQLTDNAQLARTCSIGYACLPFLPDQPRKFGWLQVIEVADQALFLAKRGGRDAWCGLSAAPEVDKDTLFERIVHDAGALVQSGELVMQARSGG